MIDVCTTATLRPEILDQTYSSFFRNFFYDDDFSLILNIDPVGPGSVDEILEVARKYFKNINFRIAPVPNFCIAVKWCWLNTSEYFSFHLEDDWVCTKKHENVLKFAIKLMFHHPNLGVIRFNKKQNWEWPIKTEDAQYEITREPIIKLSPTLYRGEICKHMAHLLNEFRDPEEQMRATDMTPAMKAYSNKWEYCRLGSQDRETFIQDIGRKWRESRNIRKNGVYWNGI